MVVDLAGRVSQHCWLFAILLCPLASFLPPSMHLCHVAFFVHSLPCNVSGVLSGVETIVPVVRPLRNVNTFRSPAVNGEEGEQEEEGSLYSSGECICCD